MASLARSIPEGELASISIPALHALGDDSFRALMSELRPLLHASELAIWVKDPTTEELVALFDTSGPSGPVELKVRQPLAVGIVSQVYRDQTPYLNRGVFRSAKQSSLVDNALNQVTQDQICVPFLLGGNKLGVVTAVQLTDAKHGVPTRWGFDEQDLKVLLVAAMALSQSLERAWWASRRRE